MKKGVVRNNLFDLTNLNTAGGDNYAIVVDRRGIEPLENDIQIYNNTIYSSASPGDNTLQGIRVGTQPTNITIKNNLMYTPNYSGVRVIDDNGSSTTKSNNSTNSQAKNTNPNWTNASGSYNTPSDFTPGAGSYAIGTGASVPVWSDFFWSLRRAIWAQSIIDPITLAKRSD